MIDLPRPHRPVPTIRHGTDACFPMTASSRSCISLTAAAPLYCKLLPAVCASLLLGISSSLGYTPPVARQGMTTVEIECPRSIEQSGLPFTATVHVINDDEQALHGTLRLFGIDGWKCDPSEAVSVQVGGLERSQFLFRVTPDKGTHAAHYPLHAIAELVTGMRRRTLHPIAIVQANLSPPDILRPDLPWQALDVGRDRVLSLWQMPVYRVVTQVFGALAETHSVGIRGTIEPHRALVDPTSMMRLEESERRCLTMHPPWFDGRSGTVLTEYPIRLPKHQKIKLSFANAVSSTGSGDGVTFRVRAADFDSAPGTFGRVLFERHSDSSIWRPAEVDLSEFAGKTIRLQLESHPGPKKNTAFDQCYWGTPTVIVGDPESLERTAATQKTFQSPLPDGGSVKIQPGQRGLLDADIEFCGNEESRISFRGFTVRVAGLELHDRGAPVSLLRVDEQPTDDGVEYRHQFATATAAFDLVARVSVRGGGLRVAWTLENEPANRPWRVTRIESIAAGNFSSVANRIYAGHGNVIEKPRPFTLRFDGHFLSTSFVGLDFPDSMSLLQAVDVPPDHLTIDPDEGRYALTAGGNATFTFFAGSNVWDLCKRFRQSSSSRAASGVKRLAGRFAFDLWGGRYAKSREQLMRSFAYGMTDSVVVWHAWQRWGYDYRLPEIYPPNPEFGSEAELRQMIDECRQRDVLFALHDNYIDFYPDAEGFSYRDVIAFDPNGRPVKAWLNEYRDARSYRYRSDAIAPFLQNNVRRIHASLAPTAYFIDVWSSVKPFDYWTESGNYFDAVFTRDRWREHFESIRKTLGNDAPQISESGHDQLIGWLDGAQTNHLRVGPPAGGDHAWSVWNINCQDAERIPWFDAVYHDRFALHGAGYSNRYQAGLDAPMHGIYSDDYITTEVLTGHPAMVSDAFGRDGVRKYWLLHDVMRELALQTIDRVEFVEDTLHRQHVRWSGGGDVWVNRATSDWQLDGMTLPPFGFAAKLPTEHGDVTASITRRAGLIVEQASAADTLYVNARSTIGGGARIWPKVTSFDSTSPKQANLTTEWKLDEDVPDDFRPFLHFVDDENQIAFQGWMDPALLFTGPAQLVRVPATVRLPETVRPGDSFELRVGFYDPSGTKERLKLMSGDDGERRVTLGQLTVEGGGDQVTGLTWTSTEDRPNPLLQRSNPRAKQVDFGWVVTAGSCRLTRQEDSLLLTPLPDENAAKVHWELRLDQLPWSVPKPTQITAIDESGMELWQKPFDEGEPLVHDPVAFAYRLD
ncbi:DUF5696 domain-containing protein [Novipirellula artificiosorum]|uniref:Uncharacterized protein n=1 Tax=Novipirellula artificiosorum TaxID=2528016 RepID=A0A5C6DFQ5_9BACT|nr:DUF5696 domain-containing protein [Novipirellula artificiosorum]TWU36103.1 hypothetical protein Poly41_38560 [Novipirellula artificiosorum]